MKSSDRVLMGVLLAIAGLILTIIGLFVGWFLIYGIPLTIIGIVVMFNKKEDKIEQIKKIK